MLPNGLSASASFWVIYVFGILKPPEFDVVKVIHVIKGTDADPALAECLIGGGHDGLFHVVEEDLNCAFTGIALNLDLMPLVVPRHLVLVVGKCFPGGAIDDHDLTAVRIGTGAEVDVVKVRGVLVVEEDTTVAMVAGVFGASNPKGKNKVTELHVLDEGDMEGTAHLWFVIVFARINPEDLVPLDIPVGPPLGVGGFPAFDALFKIFAEDEREVGL